MIKVYSDAAGSAIPPNMNTVVSGVYLHGKLEADAGMDLVVLDRFRLGLADGVHPIAVVLEKETRECVLFLWSRAGYGTGQKGLICDCTDADALQHAMSKCMDRAVCL